MLQYIFLLREPTRSGERARFPGRFSGMYRTFDGWVMGRARVSLAQGPPRHGPRYFNFPYFCMTCGLGKLEPIDQNCLEHDLCAVLLRALAMGKRQRSESIGVALDMEQGGFMNHFGICGCYSL